MLETANYKLKIYEGEDSFNPLDVENANMRTIDTAMKENQNTGDTNTAEIAQIKTVQQEHGTDIAGLQTASNTHEQEIGNLQALVNKQTGEIAEVGADVAGMQTQVSTLQTQVQTNKNQIDGLKVSVGNNTTEIASLDNRVEALEDNPPKNNITLASSTHTVSLIGASLEVITLKSSNSEKYCTIYHNTTEPIINLNTERKPSQNVFSVELKISNISTSSLHKIILASAQAVKQETASQVKLTNITIITESDDVVGATTFTLQPTAVNVIFS